jgi:hypothetical protein
LGGRVFIFGGGGSQQRCCSRGAGGAPAPGGPRRRPPPIRPPGPPARPAHRGLVEGGPQLDAVPKQLHRQRGPLHEVRDVGLLLKGPQLLEPLRVHKVVQRGVGHQAVPLQAVQDGVVAAGREEGGVEQQPRRRRRRPKSGVQETVQSGARGLRCRRPGAPLLGRVVDHARARHQARPLYGQPEAVAAQPGRVGDVLLVPVGRRW